MNSPKKDGDDDVPVKDPVKYGELVILGYNGSLPNGDRGRRKSRFALYRRAKANGVKPSAVHILNTPQDSKAVHSRGQHSISFTLSRNQTVVVEYCHDNNTDMFQIGRSTESPIDFVVTDTSGGKEGEDPSIAPSTISRFACRIVCERNPPYTARIYAAGFDSSKNIFLGEKATKWKNPDGHMDGLTTNGVLVMHPQGFPEDPKQGLWREISVCGDVYALRETRSGPSRGTLVSCRRFGYHIYISSVNFRGLCLPFIVHKYLFVRHFRRRGRAAHYVTGRSSISVVLLCCGAPVRGSCALPLCVTWRRFVRSLTHPGPSVPSASAHWRSPAFHAVIALKSVNPGSTSPVATSTDATIGARDRRERKIQERVKAPPPGENVPCAGAWVPTCRCGWAVSLRCMWMPEPPLTVLCHVATSAQRGQPSIGLRLLCPMGRMPSDPSAPSAPLP
uniref:E3 ubiquitin-protein ligase pellino homolog 2-like n=1 Tax=Pundamilia nyererei TaxID=303518 RepID=A0A3B4EVX9_9CICH